MFSLCSVTLNRKLDIIIHVLFQRTRNLNGSFYTTFVILNDLPEDGCMAGPKHVEVEHRFKKNDFFCDLSYVWCLHQF
jgi:hypothetical protein